MIHNIRRNVQLVNNTTIQGQYESLNIDMLLFTVLNPSGATVKFNEARAVNTKIVTMYRRPGSGDLPVIKSFNVLDLLKYTDAKGGRSIDSSDLDMVSICLDVGNMTFGNGEKLNVDFVCSPDTYDAGVSLTIDGIKSSDVVTSPLKGYESFIAAGGEATFKGCLELYQTSAPTGQILDVKDGQSSYSMSDISCKSLAQANMRIEHQERDFGLVWQDPNHVGRDVIVKADANTTFFAVKAL